MSNNSSGSGFPFMFVLFLVLLVLKLTEVISWPWWLVCLPVYGPACFFLILAAVCFTLAGAITLAVKVGEKGGVK